MVEATETVERGLKEAQAEPLFDESTRRAVSAWRSAARHALAQIERVERERRAE